jgi:hypothetical protein
MSSYPAVKATPFRPLSRTMLVMSSSCFCVRMAYTLLPCSSVKATFEMLRGGPWALALVY